MTAAQGRTAATPASRGRIRCEAGPAAQPGAQPASSPPLAHCAGQSISTVPAVPVSQTQRVALGHAVPGGQDHGKAFVVALLGAEWGGAGTASPHRLQPHPDRRFPAAGPTSRPKPPRPPTRRRDADREKCPESALKAPQESRTDCRPAAIARSPRFSVDATPVRYRRRSAPPVSEAGPAPPGPCPLAWRDRAPHRRAPPAPRRRRPHARRPRPPTP